MRTEKQVLAEMAPLYAELNALRENERKAQHKLLLGKCFRFRNSYGSGEQWWLYARVDGVGGHWPMVFTFQVTSQDEIIVKCKDSSHVGGDSWFPITRREFDREWAKVQKRIASFH